MFNKIDTKTFFISLYVFAILVFIAHFIIVVKGVYGDARYYYSYLTSIVIDHNLDFKSSFKYFGIDYFLTPTGKAANIYPIGPAIFWAFPFILAHLFLMPFGLNDGFNNFYQFFIGIWNITLVFIGLYFLKKTLTKFFSKKISRITIAAMFLSTNLLFYGAIDVINSHSASFFAASLFVYFWLNKKIKLSAVLLGLLALIRPQDALFAILPLSSLILEKRSYLKNFLVLMFGALIVFIPQLLIWKILWGTWYKSPYLEVEGFNFTSPQIFGVLFSGNSGLILWTPIILICFLGLIGVAQKNKVLGVPFILLVLAQIYTVSSWSIWWQGASYSGRMFVSSLPILSIGLGYFYSQKFFVKYYLFITFFFSVLNMFLIIFFLSRN